jgi:methyl-accepting chemotaxis protein
MAKRKSKTVKVRGRKYWRAAKEFAPTWKDKKVEFESAQVEFESVQLDFNFATDSLNKIVREMNDAAAAVARALRRLEAARTAMKRVRK